MDSFGKPKRRDEAKEISFKKFQKSATKHDTFVIKRQRQAFVRFLYHSMVLTTVKLSPNFKGFTAAYYMQMTLQSFYFRQL